MAKQDPGVSFTRAETETLKQIVSDWLNEEIVAPPFSPEIEAVLEKLDLAAPSRAAAPPPRKQDSRPRPHASRPGTRSPVSVGE